jgi:hypothetical protein
MTSYVCIVCDTKVNDRERHAASKQHIANGGSSTVVDEEYRLDGGGGPTVDPTGTSKVR